MIGMKKRIGKQLYIYIYIFFFKKHNFLKPKGKKLQGYRLAIMTELWSSINEYLWEYAIGDILNIKYSLVTFILSI